MKWFKAGSGGEINFAIEHPNIGDVDKQLIEEIIFDKEPFNWLPRNATMLDVLVAAEIFKSKNDARNNWKEDFKIPEGFNEWRNVGKYKKNIFIHKVPDNMPSYEA